MNAAPRMLIASRGTALASAQISEPLAPGPLTGSVHAHLPIAIDHLGGVIRPAQPRASS
jgi:hypothetical protein